MDGDESVADLDVWGKLLSEQTALFTKISTRNKALEVRVEELERELQVWKVAYKTAEDEKDVLTKKVTKLERNIGTLKDDNPLVVCLIDGDGNIFAADLLVQGQAGGRHAAMLLTQGLNSYMAESMLDNAKGKGKGKVREDSPGRPMHAGRAQLLLTVYCNKRGLSETLVNAGVCTAEQFEEFVMGFNQASPLFSFVDVGGGKEAADSKIKECLRVFTRFPQTARVFFGGAHDNGYTSTLTFLHNEGLDGKVVILRGYKDLASEVRSLNLPHLDIEGVFITKKLQTTNLHGSNNSHSREPKREHTSHNHKGANSAQSTERTQTASGQILDGNSRSYSPVTLQDFEKFRTTASASPRKGKNSALPTPSSDGTRQLTPGVPLHKQRPPPCNFYYLGNCVMGPKCRFAHDYDLKTEHVDELRKNAKKWPCPYVNRSKPCPYGRTCCMAHRCPHGSTCAFAKSGKCKFIAPSMHRSSPPSSRSAEASISTPHSPSPTRSGYIDSLPMSPSAPSVASLPMSPAYSDAGNSDWARYDRSHSQLSWH